MEIKRMRKRQRQKERGIVNGLHLYCALQERKRESEREMERKTERQVNPIFESWKEAAERRQPRGGSREEPAVPPSRAASPGHGIPAASGSLEMTEPG